MTHLAPKETHYKNISFPSQLEAQWAVFFDALGITYEYEPERDEVDFGIGVASYIPDFFLPDLNLWVEVKPVSLMKMSYGDRKKCEGWAKDRDGILILIGPPSIPRESTSKHEYLTWMPKKNQFFLGDHWWWCECMKCGRVDIRPYGGNPVDCDETCFPEATVDLFGEEVPDPEGQRSKRLREACHRAKAYEFQHTTRA